MNNKNQEKELARLYYMQGEQQKTIAEKLGIGENTVARWVKDGQWEARRAALNITRPEIVNKILVLISKILEKVDDIEEMEPEALAKLISQIQKLANSIEKLDKRATVMDNIETFQNFNRWMESQMKYDAELTPQLLTKIAQLEDQFVQAQFDKGKRM
jgi:transcriptional regulator with XRE-family HTH domain